MDAPPDTMVTGSVSQLLPPLLLRRPFTAGVGLPEGWVWNSLKGQVFHRLDPEPLRRPV
jgi:hypothetical protein